MFYLIVLNFYSQIIFKKDTPHSLLLLSTVLNHKTSPSGHTGRPQNIESMTTLIVNTVMAAKNPSFNPL